MAESGTQPASIKGSGGAHVVAPFPVYEELLNRDPRWALSEGSRHFEENSAVFQALHKVASRLKELKIPYAVIGGMALFRHGLRRFTEDVDLLVKKDDLKIIHQKLAGLGYLPPFANSKHLRDTELGVRIEFLTAGEFPGDGKPKPVAFPDPLSASFEAEGISYIRLPKLVELKLASGMTNAGRLKDLSDVLELIKTLNLPLDFANQLDAYVQPRFQELWSKGRKRYITIWRDKRLTPEVKTIEDLIQLLGSAAGQLEQMQKDGVILDEAASESVRLVTTDPNVAEKYGLVEESEYWEGETYEGSDNPQSAEGDSSGT